MQIHINTHDHIEGYERMEAYFSETITNALKRFEDKITRIEVHLNDENGEKFGEKRCTIEARIAGMQPIAANNHADTTEKAVAGAIDKLKHQLTTAFDKMKSH